MPEEKNIIRITKDQGTPQQEDIDIMTDGFIILYLKEDKIRGLGDIELKALAPLLMKVAVDKWAGSKD